VEVVLNFRHIRRLKLLLEQSIDVEVGEPWVRQDFVDAVLAEALSAILVQQLGDQVLSFG